MSPTYRDRDREMLWMRSVVAALKADCTAAEAVNRADRVVTEYDNRFSAPKEPA